MEEENEEAIGTSEEGSEGEDAGGSEGDLGGGEESGGGEGDLGEDGADSPASLVERAGARPGGAPRLAFRGMNAGETNR